MCSFILTTKVINDENIDTINNYAKLRGPDYTSVKKYDKFYMVHNLLDISTKSAVQPVIHDEKILLYNGEIYNFNSDCDTYQILPLFCSEFDTFTDQIDGEYAIVVVDLRKDVIFMYTDVFATKPIHYSYENGHIGIASYKSSLVELGFENIKQMPCSTKIEINVKSNKVCESKHSPFDINEHVDTYDYCIDAFEHAVNKRCSKKCALGLSDGYDSGSILQAVVNKKQLHTTLYYIDTGCEDPYVMKNRLNMLPNYKRIDFSTHGILKANIEKKRIHSIVEEYTTLDDIRSTPLLSQMFQAIRNSDINIFITGHGADEILSNYTYTYKQKPFFYDLTKQFPWNNFYGGKNYKYINQHEYIGGVYGIEVRYPFLDKSFVQSFLNLTPKLKNKKYKNVLCEYMERNNTPFVRNRKRGLHAAS